MAVVYSDTHTYEQFLSWFRFSLDLSLFCMPFLLFFSALFAVVVLSLVSSVAETLARKNVSEMTCFVSSGS